MPNAESIQPDTRSFNLFIGRSGSGKSAAAYSYPKAMRVEDLDGRIRGGLTYWNERKGIEYEYYPPRDQKSVFERLNKNLEAMEVLIKTGQKELETYVFDSLTWASTDFLLDAIPLTHESGKGKSMGGLNIAGPSDYSFQSTAIWQVIAYLKTLPIKHVIVTAHITNRWGKRKNANGEIIDPYGPNEVIGEQLFLTDKLAEAVPSSFDNIFYFEKDSSGRRFYFSAYGELARTAYIGLTPGRHDITETSFFKYLMSKVSPTSATTAGAVK